VCGTKCGLDLDPLACGPTCAACPVPPNATAACQAGACTFACVAGHADCNDLPVDGCEATLATDPLNCGACHVSCAGRPCTNGVCQAAPPPPPPPPP
jgi:hypothetical protein